MVKLAVGFADSQINLVVQQVPQGSNALRLVHFILAASQHPNREIVELTFEFWSSFANRQNDRSGDELLVSFMDAMIPKLEYPQDYFQFGNYVFNNNSLDTEEKDQFHKFRVDASDTLLSVYYVLLSKYFTHMTQTLRSTRDFRWQRLESCIYIVCAASDAARCEELNDIIPAVIEIAQKFSEPQIKQTNIRFIGLYANYLGKNNAQVVLWALQYVLEHVKNGDIQASKSFVNICEASKSNMDANVWSSLAETCVSNMNNLPITITSNIYEGLSYVAANANHVDVQKKILYIMMKPILEQFQNIKTIDHILVELTKFKACFKAFENTTPSALPLIMTQVWPTIEGLFANFRHQEVVVQKLCEVATCISLSAGDDCLGDKFIHVMCVVLFSNNQYGFLMDTIGYLARMLSCWY
jgi:hypothetical protein